MTLSLSFFFAPSLMILIGIFPAAVDLRARWAILRSGSMQEVRGTSEFDAAESTHDVLSASTP